MYQVTDLRQSTATGQWLDIQKSVYMGSKDNNPIYKGSLGEYNGCILHESTRVPSVTAGVYRAIFCGAQAAAIGFGQNSAPTKMSWVEELFDSILHTGSFAQQCASNNWVNSGEALALAA